MLTLVTEPTVEPVSLEELRAHLRLDSNAEDALLGIYLQAARQRVEGACGRQLCGATWELVLDAFPWGDTIELPRAPLRSVSSVKYLDENGVEQTWSSGDYRVEAPAGPHAPPGVLSLDEDAEWPDSQPVRGAVKIRYVAGYSAPGATQAVASAAVPGPLRAAVLLTAAEMYARREDAIAGVSLATVPLSSRALWMPFKV